MIKMTLDEKLDIADAFLQDFKALVRKYVPTDEEDWDELLYLLQERTSVFAPYIWDDDEELKNEQ